MLQLTLVSKTTGTSSNKRMEKIKAETKNLKLSFKIILSKGYIKGITL